MTGRICGTGSYVPARIVENDELANLVDTNDAWDSRADRNCKKTSCRE